MQPNPTLAFPLDRLLKAIDHMKHDSPSYQYANNRLRWLAVLTDAGFDADQIAGMRMTDPAFNDPSLAKELVRYRRSLALLATVSDHETLVAVLPNFRGRMYHFPVDAKQFALKDSLTAKAIQKKLDGLMEYAALNIEPPPVPLTPREIRRMEHELLLS